MHSALLGLCVCREFQNGLEKMFNIQPEIKDKSQFLDRERDNDEHTYSTVGLPSLKHPGNLFSEPRGRFLSPPLSMPSTNRQTVGWGKISLLKQSSLYLLFMIIEAWTHFNNLLWEACVCVTSLCTKSKNIMLLFSSHYNWVEFPGWEGGFLIIGASALGKILMSLHFNCCPFFCSFLFPDVLSIHIVILLSPITRGLFKYPFLS